MNWYQLVAFAATQLLILGAMYGRMSQRLTSIEWRLGQIESMLGIGERAQPLALPHRR
jgi:hypothetical protein